ncbi:MAG: AgmX/PglI C-terminal domain-containing protein [Rhodobacterales bacterium]|nr:AgmX/PglI C-terminal domain-containing protein [Rhodobacterales bacterium]
MKHRTTLWLLALVACVAALTLFTRQSPPAPPEPVETPTTKTQRPAVSVPVTLPRPKATAVEHKQQTGHEFDAPARPKVPETDAIQAPASPDEPTPRLGALSSHSIDDGIREAIPEIRDCYLETLAEIPELEGRLKVKFTIEEHEGSGWVKDVSVAEADFDDVPLEDCIMDVMETVEFEPPDGGVVLVSYPFFFELPDP